MLVTFALLQVTEVNGNVLKEIEDIEDTTETKDIDIVQGAQGSKDACLNMCVEDFRGVFEDHREDKKKMVACDGIINPYLLPKDIREWCNKCNPGGYKVQASGCPCCAVECHYS
eukprot:Nk52_evm5s348 gene=Nk52_evmTU5s348